MTQGTLATFWIDFRVDPPPSFAQRLSPLPPGVALVKEGSLHLTLVYLGYCKQTAAKAAFLDVVAVVEHARREGTKDALQVRLGALRPFGGAGEVIAATLFEGPLRMKRLIEKSRAAAMQSVASKAMHQWEPHPHVTVAKVAILDHRSDERTRWRKKHALTFVRDAIQLETVRLWSYSVDRGKKLVLAHDVTRWDRS